MPNLIIIGNGFDLAHNLETSYPQFIKYLVDSNRDNVIHKDLFIRPVEMFYEELRRINHYDIHLRNTVKNNLLIQLILNHFLQNWSDVEELYFRHLYNIGENSATYDKPEILNKEFDQIKSALIQYLEEQETRPAIDSYNKLFKTLDSENTLVLNFNYTNTIENLYSETLTNSKELHFHGELGSITNPIVFGYAATHNESRKLVEKNNNEFMKNIKKHLYKRAENESLLTKYLNDYKLIKVLILGHSCGISDKLILNQILTHDNVETIRTFYFEKYENYFDTIVNIDRIMNDDEKFKNRVIDFNRSSRMPQHDDDESRTYDFKHYIIKFLNPQMKYLLSTIL